MGITKDNGPSSNLFIITMFPEIAPQPTRVSESMRYTVFTYPSIRVNDTRAIAELTVHVKWRITRIIHLFYPLLSIENSLQSNYYNLKKTKTSLFNQCREHFA